MPQKARTKYKKTRDKTIDGLKSKKLTFAKSILDFTLEKNKLILEHFPEYSCIFRKLGNGEVFELFIEKSINKFCDIYSAASAKADKYCLVQANWHIYRVMLG